MIWKDIKGYEGVYQISDGGQVKALSKTVYMGYENRAKRYFPEHILKHNINHKGYPYVNLCHNTIQRTITIHRLVAVAFIPNPNNKPQVNHKDGNKLNNCVENLEWCSGSENQQHAYDKGLNTRIKKCPAAVKVIVEKLNGDFVGEFDSIKQAAKFLKSSRTHASRVLSGIKKSCKGHIIKPLTT